MDNIILYLTKSLYTKLHKGNIITLKKEMMQQKPRTIETEIPYEREIETAFNKNKGYRYKKIVAGNGIHFSLDSDEESGEKWKRMTRPKMHTQDIRGGSILKDIGHTIIHTALPKLGSALAVGATNLIGAPELSILAAKLGDNIGQSLASKFTEISGIGLKPRYLGLKKTGKRTYSLLHM